MQNAAELYGQPWQVREYLIALASYLRHREKTASLEAQHIQELARLLGRTPASILMRMENFASLDSNVHRKGLANVSPMCRQIFEEWNQQQDKLLAVADFLTGELNAPQQLGLFESPKIRMPKAFNRYELLDYIGQGGFGDVYSCIQKDTSCLFAIKIVRADRANDKEALHRFSREMRALKSIKHPNVITLYEDNLDHESEFPGFVMDLATTRLSDFIEKHSIRTANDAERPLLETGSAMEIMRSMLTAAGALHNHQPRILHRDINPNNILLLPDGRWVLADFSLAKFTGSNSTLATYTQRGWGTTYYAAPEQYNDFKRTNEKADIYSLGILLWELFSPAWPSPQFERSLLPDPLDKVYRRATELDVHTRYCSAEEMTADFEAAASQL